MDIATIANLLGVAVTALATVVLAWLTGRYVKLTKVLADEAKASKEPNVYIDLEFSTRGVKLLLGNSGSSPARNISFKVSDNIPWRQIDHAPKSLAELPVLKHGISYLAPGRVLKYEAGVLPHDRDVFSPEHVVSIEISFQTETAQTRTSRADIGLGQYSQVLYESFKTPEHDMAEALRESASQQRSSNTRLLFRSKPARKSCPTCGELIATAAKKCPHCWEQLSSPDGHEKKGESGANNALRACLNFCV